MLYVYNTIPYFGVMANVESIQWTVIIALIAILNTVVNIYCKYIQI